MTAPTLSRHRAASPTPVNERRRVLLFDGNDVSVSTAAPALGGLGIDVVHSELKALAFEPSADTCLAVVVSAPQGGARDTTHLVRQLREVSMLPVLILAANMQDDLLLQELSTPGATGCGPVPLELAQQIRAILRRDPSRVLRFGPLEIDTGSRKVRVDHETVDLSPREFDLITFLASSPGRAFTRLELLHAVWHSSVARQTESTVTEHVRRIRVKLHTDPDVPRWLVTVRGTGYRFQP